MFRSMLGKVYANTWKIANEKINMELIDNM